MEDYTTDQEQQVEVTQEAPEQVEQPQQASTPSPQESFRQLREKAERAERERDEMRRILEQTYAQNQKAASEESEEDQNELIERRHLKKYDSELQKMRREVESTRQSLAEQRLKQLYPDFDKVVTESTIAEFKSQNPEIATSLSQTGDLYATGKAVYSLIKSTGIYKDESYAADKQRAEYNTAKPRPSNSISPQRGETPLSHANAFANGLTDDLKKQLWKEMEQARKGSI